MPVPSWRTLNTFSAEALSSDDDSSDESSEADLSDGSSDSSDSSDSSLDDFSVYRAGERATLSDMLHRKPCPADHGERAWQV